MAQGPSPNRWAVLDANQDLTRTMLGFWRKFFTHILSTEGPIEHDTVHRTTLHRKRELEHKLQPRRVQWNLLVFLKHRHTRTAAFSPAVLSSSDLHLQQLTNDIGEDNKQLDGLWLLVRLRGA